MKRFLAYCTATFFFSGRSPIAPGTAGSFASLIPLTLLAYTLSPLSYAVLLAIGILVFIGVGIPAATYVERCEGREDPGLVVIDEAAGQWITFLFVPSTLLVAHPWLIGVGFILFRSFDITKPFPARKAEMLPAGYGIVLDDVVAGLYAMIVLNLIVKLFIL